MERNHICKKCGGIAGWDSYFQSWICTRCGNNEPKPTTNADRIRSMTDEELANKFEEIQLQTVKAYGNDHLLLKGELKKYWLNWLKEEEKNETK